MAPDQRPPEKLPDPWLFDTEKLLRELGRLRELILAIPTTDHATHFAINIAINANWNLEENIRHLLHLHIAGQHVWTNHANELPNRQTKRNDTPTEVRPIAANRSA